MTYLRNYAVLQRQGPAGARPGRRRGAACSARATTRCASGSTRRRSPSAACRRATSSPRSATRTCRSRPASSARRPDLHGIDVQLSVNAQGRLQNEEEFGDIIVKTGADGAVTRLRDVARIELGAADYSLRSLLDNKDAVAIAASSRRPAPTRSQISDDVRATMAELQKTMPDGVDVRDRLRPDAVRARVHRVGGAHAARGHRAGRAGRDPVPADLARVDHPAARRAGVDRRHLRGDASLFGFSINALSLFGLVLAIGIVVDDAIVVVENVERNIAAGLIAARGDLPRDARGLRARSSRSRWCWCAVFVPLAFISGPDRPVLPAVRADHRDLDGDLGGQLADAVAGARRAAAARPRRAQGRARRAAWTRCSAGFFGAFNRLFHRGADAYSGGVTRRDLERKAVMLGVYLAARGRDRWASSRPCRAASCRRRTSST